MKKIAIIPTSNFYSSNNLFKNEFNRDNRIFFYLELRKFLYDKSIDLNTIDVLNELSDLDAIIFERFDHYYLRLMLNKYPNILRIFIPWEPEVVSPLHSKGSLKKLSKYFDYVLTWNDDLVDGLKFIKLNYPHILSLNNTVRPDYYDYQRRKKLVQVSSNLKSRNNFELYSLRKSLNYLANEFFGLEFEFYGRGWQYHNLSYKGVIEDKISTIRNYRFSLSIENTYKTNGYITEKIFDCFIAGVVPIYLGADNISKYVPSNTFIDYKLFDTPNQLFDYIDNLNYDEWSKYLLNARRFLESDLARPFSYNVFNEIIFKSINKDKNFSKPKLIDLLYFESVLFSRIVILEQILFPFLSRVKRNILNIIFLIFKLTR
jgi:alpha(1,3/1,4) fucosyltransferase